MSNRLYYGDNLNILRERAGAARGRPGPGDFCGGARHG